MTRFQLILLGIFAFFIIFAVIIFSASKGGSSVGESTVSVWGTMSVEAFNAVFGESSLAGDDSIRVTYRSILPDVFEQTLTEALAIEQGPDLFFVTNASLIKNREKIFFLPFKSYPERIYKDTYIEAAELFLDDDGLYAIPFLVDPIVMYWNRDIFSEAGLSEPLRYWDELFNLSQSLTRYDDRFNIIRATTALGEYENITHAKDIFAAMVLQTGNKIVERKFGQYVSTLSERYNYPEAPAVSVLRFFSDFANPTKSAYTWNRSLPQSRDHFIAGDLALYFGFASEIESIQQKNPNLNFDVAGFPQLRQAATSRTMVRITGLAISRQSPNPSAAFTTALALSSGGAQAAVETELIFPSVERKKASSLHEKAFLDTFSKSVLIGRSWYDPDPVLTDRIFEQMVEGVVTGSSDVASAVGRASAEIEAEFR